MIGVETRACWVVASRSTNCCCLHLEVDVNTRFRPARSRPVRVPRVAALAGFLAALGLIASPLPAQGQKAEPGLGVQAVTTQALSGCPTGGEYSTSWIVDANGNVQSRDRGITKCLFEDGHVIIIDLTKGAKIRLMSTPDGARGLPSTQFYKRSVHDWFDRIRTNADGLVSPAPSRLFAVANASFMRNTNAWPWTALSFPHKRARQVMSVGEDANAAIDYQQRVLGLGILGQDGSVGEWPKEAVHPVRDFDYAASRTTGVDVNDVNQKLSDFVEAIVGYAPLAAATATNHTRNYIGVGRNASGGVDYVYLLQDWDTTTTREQATDRMFQFTGDRSQIIQLDGGGSTSYRDGGGNACHPNGWSCRALGDVMAIYLGP